MALREDAPMTTRPVIPMLDVNMWVNDATTPVARLLPDSDRATVKFRNDGQSVAIYGDPATLRRLLDQLTEQLDAAETALRAEELNEIDAEEDRLATIDLMHPDLTAEDEFLARYDAAPHDRDTYPHEPDGPPDLDWSRPEPAGWEP